MTLILFPADPFTPRQPDSLYADEQATAEAVGFTTAVINYEDLVYNGNGVRATRFVPSDSGPALYRGWMMRPADYERLYAGLAEKGVTMLTDPAAYRYCHYLPDSYAAIAGNTPKSVWLAYDADFSWQKVMRLLDVFGDSPLIVKDYVKSRKHEWEEACYIPAANDRAAVERVAGTFLERQGEDLNEGLVFREFVNFRPLGTHAKSGMPLTVEYRLFVMNGVIAVAYPYWEGTTYPGTPPPLEQFATIAARIPSPFYTMDIAQTVAGAWLITELGDGQVAGLPESANVAEFYQILKN